MSGIARQRALFAAREEAALANGPRAAVTIVEHPDVIKSGWIRGTFVCAPGRLETVAEKFAKKGMDVVPPSRQVRRAVDRYLAARKAKAGKQGSWLPGAVR